MRVVAVVVTFNRLSLLQGLVARLREVSDLAEILVINNASSDGTDAWLASQPEVVSRTLTENLGGAGGFHDGLDWAMQRDADLVWLMDDDGLPDLDCLPRLLEHRGDLDFWGPIVLAEDEPDVSARLVFPIRLPGTATILRTTPDVERQGPLLQDVVIPFNGVLVTRELVERIGLPRAEFFIWGDDVEYLWRAREAGARVATVTGAKVRHPRVGDLGTSMMFGRTTYNHTPSELKHYCMARNNTVNLRTYRGWPFVLLFWAKTLWFYLFTQPQPARIPMSVRAAYAGLRGDFTGHQRYLT